MLEARSRHAPKSVRGREDEPAEPQRQARTSLARLHALEDLDALGQHMLLADAAAPSRGALDWIFDQVESGALDEEEIGSVLGALERRVGDERRSERDADARARSIAREIAAESGVNRPDDEARAAAIAATLVRVLPQVGLAVGREALRIDARAGARARSRGVPAFVEDDAIWLDVRAVDPATAHGREVIAHEAIHLAQAQRGTVRATAAVAELEAAHGARSFAHGHALTPPVVTLSRGEVAAFSSMSEAVRGLIADAYALGSGAHPMARSFLPVVRRWADGNLGKRDEVEAPEVDETDETDEIGEIDEDAALAQPEAEGEEGRREDKPRGRWLGRLVKRSAELALRSILAFAHLVRVLPREGVKEDHRDILGMSLGFRLSAGIDANFRNARVWGSLMLDLFGFKVLIGRPGNGEDRAPMPGVDVIFDLDLRRALDFPPRIEGQVPNVNIGRTFEAGPGRVSNDRLEIDRIALTPPRLPFGTWTPAAPKLALYGLSIGTGAPAPRLALEPGESSYALGSFLHIDGLHLEGGAAPSRADGAGGGYEVRLGARGAGLRVFGCDVLTAEDVEIGLRLGGEDWALWAELGHGEVAGPLAITVEGARLSTDEGLAVESLAIGAPPGLRKLIEHVTGVTWTMQRRADPHDTAEGLPDFRLVWRGLKFNGGELPTGLLPAIEPDLRDWVVSIAVDDWLRLDGLTLDVEGPLAPALDRAPTESDTSGTRLALRCGSGALNLFGMKIDMRSLAIGVDATGLRGALARASIDPIAEVSGLTLDAEGLSIAHARVGYDGPLPLALQGLPLPSNLTAELVVRGLVLRSKAPALQEATLRIGQVEVSLASIGVFALQVVQGGFDLAAWALAANDLSVWALARSAHFSAMTVGAVLAPLSARLSSLFHAVVDQVTGSGTSPAAPASSSGAPTELDVRVARAVHRPEHLGAFQLAIAELDKRLPFWDPSRQAAHATAATALATGHWAKALLHLHAIAAAEALPCAAIFLVITQAALRSPPVAGVSPSVLVGDAAPGPESDTHAADADAGTTELGTQTSAEASAKRMMVVDPDARLRDPKNLRKTLGADRSLPQGLHVEVIETLGTYVRVISAPGEVPVIDESAQAWTAAMNLGGLGADVGLGNERSDEESAAQSEAIRAALPPGRKPGQGGHGWRFGKSFALSLDGTSIDGELLDKVVRLCEWAAFNDMITDEIVIGSGMRSLANAHALCVSWEIQFGERVTLEALRALPDGKDRDGNLWYREGWTWEQIKANANAIRARTQDATASEGYPPGDPRRLPVDDTRDVSRHCSGGAIDVTIPWRVSGKDAGSNATDVWGWPEIYTQFGLRRPVSSEAWHVQATSTQLAPDPVPETTAETPADTGTRPTSTAAIEPGPSAPDTAPGDDVPTHQDEQQTYSAIAWDGIRRATNSAASWWYGEGEVHSSTPDHSTPLPAGEPTANLDESEPGTEASVGSEQADDAAYLDQVDNESPYSEGTAQCSPTSFTMQLIGVYQGDVEAVKARAREILDERGERSDYEQPEDLIIEILQTTDWDKACAEKPSFFWSPRTWAEWAAKKYQGKYYKDPNAQQYVASLFDAVGNTGEQTLSKCYTRKDWAPVIDALAKGALVSGQGAFTEDGHVVSIIAADDDGVVINDPFGLYVEGGYYLMNGHRPRVSLASSGLETLGRRARLRPDVVEAYHANEALPNWGQSNFYSWADVVAVQLGRWLSVLSRR